VGGGGEGVVAGGRSRVAKPGRAGPLPVERSVGGEDRGTEPRDELGESRLARLDDLACEEVGVDDRGAALDEETRDGTLARCDPASQPYDVCRHRSGVTTPRQEWGSLATDVSHSEPSTWTCTSRSHVHDSVRADRDGRKIGRAHV